MTLEDIKIAEDIFGKNINALKGKTVRKTPIPVITDYVDVPREILKAHRNVILSGDIFFLQGYPFFSTLSRNIKFNTVELLDNMENNTLVQACTKVFNIYTRRGFCINTMLMDMQFESLKHILMRYGVVLNCSSAKEHVGEIERFIRVIKERIRALRSRMPYKAIPKRLVIALVKHVCKWLNVFPPKNAIPGISPRTLITGVKLDFNTQCRIEVGAYAQVHEEPNPTNDTEKYRTTGAIALEANDNLQGGYKFLSLTTGRVIDRRNFTILPITTDVINRVNELAANEGEFVFGDRNNNIDTDSVLTGVDNDDNDNDSEYDTDSDSDDESLPDMIQDDIDSDSDSDDEDDCDDNNNIAEQPVRNYDEDQDDDPDIESLQSELQRAQDEFDEIKNLSTIEETDDDDYVDDEEQSVENIEDRNEQQNHGNNNEKDDNSVKTTRSGRVSKKNDYLSYEPDFGNKKYKTHNNINISSEDADEMVLAHIFAFVFEQYSYNKGVKKFGEVGERVTFEELNQLHKRGTFVPVLPSEMTDDDKKKIVDAIALIEEKRDGRVKGRVVAAGNQQREQLKKDGEDVKVSSPTVSLEAIMLTCIIEALERRYVAVVDLPNAFILTGVDKKDTVILKIRGKIAELLVQTAPELYRKYVIIENGKPVLYVEAWNAIYGTIQAALLFYNKYKKDLLKKGFIINPYDPCVANKMINGKQCTVTWHVDDVKVSHVDSKVVEDFIEWVKEKYEDPEIGKVKVSRGKRHDYLGMILDYNTDGSVTIDMVDYIKKMIEDFPEDTTATATTPAALHLFEVRDDAEKLSEDLAIIFHNLVARGLFACKQARPDIMTAIAFLTTRVSNPDIDDWKKLKRVINYLRGTKDLVLKLSADKNMIPKWSIDVAYAVHKDMRSHTGSSLTLGKGGVNNSSIKQKINTRSSTEAEVVGVDDMMGPVLWTNYFLEAQGYKTSDTIIYQDNKSAILLEKNGKASSGKRTKHINIRYFFITDMVDKKQVRIEYCPTDDMVADFFSKPLQGNKFIKFRNSIMNIK
jgi:hypothetical protein